MSTPTAGPRARLEDGPSRVPSPSRSAPSDTAAPALALAQAEASPDGLVVVSPEGRILSANGRFAEIWGFERELIADGDERRALEAAAARVSDPESFLARVREVYQRPVRSHDEVELRDGRVLDRYGAPLFSDGRYLGYAWYFRDVTAQKRAEFQLRELAHTLQGSLLPPRPPAIPGMEVAVRYRSGSPGLTVGGDFYDVFRLRSNAWGVVIGDVCGKGAQAAALTALARYTVRAAAVHADRPADVLREVNATLLDDPTLEERFCSLVYARVEHDWCGAWVTLAAGGHPLPLVLRRSGWVDVRGQSGGLLGLFDTVELEEDRVGLGPGDAIVLCTDGITEARGARGELFGDDRLFSVLAGLAGAGAEDIAEAVVEQAVAFSSGPVNDDIAVVVLRVPPEAAEDPGERLRAATGAEVSPVSRSCGDTPEPRNPAPREARLPLRPDASCAPEARAFLRSVLRSWRMPELATMELELVTAELVANALRHSGQPHVMVVGYDGRRIRVEVGDGSRLAPRPRHPAADEPDGRGLGIVETLALRWGVSPTRTGKRVWAELPAD